MKTSELGKTLAWMALSGQIQHFKNQLPMRFLWAFAGWLAGILTAICLVT